ncbi:uncharacterized protein F4822DRAFT_431281 [Hypoxylon trugodes]|uniref:uncharacterized protein n=1 Tax=Hypoxylon trugodes TaxID=326681 RepID=UPI00219DDA12|nr:uncharacterized protein F4822DRAFT_431281 [Hypoxylon trugodes]KAI1386411.1 hypothetical protein F4822DRAFT_431281 [Hypoxylon trugodes]
MKFAIVVTLAAVVVVASNVDNRGPTSILEEPYSTISNTFSLDIRDVSEESRNPIENGSPIADKLCLHSVEEIEADESEAFFPYSVEELIAVKGELERSGNCSSFRESLRIDNFEVTQPEETLEPRSESNTHQNVAKCVNAILPGSGAGVAPGDADDSAAIRNRLSTAALIVAIAVLTTA